MGLFYVIILYILIMSCVISCIIIKSLNQILIDFPICPQLAETVAHETRIEIVFVTYFQISFLK